MKKKLLIKLILLAGVLFLSSIVLPGEVAAADPPAMVGKIKDAFVTIGGSIVIIGWIVAGILYLTAAGSPEKTGTAKKALIAAVIGTALIILAVGAEATIKALLGA